MSIIKNKNYVLPLSIILFCYNFNIAFSDPRRYNHSKSSETKWIDQHKLDFHNPKLSNENWNKFLAPRNKAYSDIVLYFKNKQNYESEKYKCDKEIILLLDKYVKHSSDYVTSLDYLDECIKGNYDKNELIENINALIFKTIKKYPIDDYIKIIKDIRVKTKAREIWNEYKEYKKQWELSDVYNVYKIRSILIENEIENIISIKGLSNNQIRQLEELRIKINKLHEDICMAVEVRQSATLLQPF